MRHGCPMQYMQAVASLSLHWRVQWMRRRCRAAAANLFSGGPSKTWRVWTGKAAALLLLVLLLLLPLVLVLLHQQYDARDVSCGCTGRVSTHRSAL